MGGYKSNGSLVISMMCIQPDHRVVNAFQILSYHRLSNPQLRHRLIFPVIRDGVDKESDLA